MVFDDIGVDCRTVVFNGTTYVVTTGTGEVSCGDLGEACFAYYASDVDVTRASTYQDACDRLTPVGGRDLAIVLAAEGLRLLESGTCEPILSDEEYEAARNVG